MKALLFLSCFLLFGEAMFAQSVASGGAVSLEIRNILEASTPGSPVRVGDELLRQYEELIQFYADRAFTPAWPDDQRGNAAVQELLVQIEDSKYDGLKPSSYHLSAIREIAASSDAGRNHENPVHQAYMDLVLSDAFLSLAHDLYLGKVSQEGLQNSWGIEPKHVKTSFGTLLEEGLSSGRIKESLVSLWPRYQVYKSMRRTMKRYFRLAEAMEEPWDKLRGKTIKVNEESRLIPEVRKRLQYWNDLEADNSGEEERYDSSLFDGVRYFQKRNGLEADGIIGKDTYTALNESPASLIRKVAVNMERMRWLPDTVLNGRFVMVNIANFQLDYLQDNGLDTVFTSKVIVGKEYHTTPVFNGEMAYIVLSPTWTVPSSIIRREMIPKIKKDVSYLSRNHFKILTYSGKEVSPSSIDWSKASAGNFPYMIRQSPGTFNSLGQVKFIFPNKHNVYIHDTPVKSLFSRDLRAFSHGCIRIQKPAEFAAVLLEGDHKWNLESIRAGMESGRETTVLLKKKVPVVLIYLTLWTDPAGKTYLRKDIYERDEAIAKALLLD
ncbi:L,D-transpeptidase family protein [Echinicola soli]|uniref:L,D-transpeptidase family protein n=1 Tax=Echinicola soli TaxID=2591634 RepID=A0A514CHS9_9BACT|nr:L,D-transpeptidase family protein [Echinicola soli]QDH79381.1 L,D-transpeptidase family protein [Echinicola soli]